MLVAPNGNAGAAVHRWFHLKEAYSSRLLGHLLREIAPSKTSELRILDPYAGVGTTAVSLADLVLRGELTRVCSYGIECNGFLHLVASAKLAALQRPPKSFVEYSRRLTAIALSSQTDEPEIPALSTFEDPDFFDREDLIQLLRLRDAILEEANRGQDPVATALANACLGAIIEPVSNLRRDGRALRYTQKRDRPPTIQAFLAKAKQVGDDLPQKPVRVVGRIIRGDGRRCEGIDGRFDPFDIIVFSPPYPNNIDYTEVYKLENWLLGFIEDQSSFAQQRMRTVYSHPSVLRPDPLPSIDLSTVENEVALAVIEPILASIPNDRYLEGRRRMIRGYARDMLMTLKSARARLAPNGRIVYVVGNSVHGAPPNQFVIAADLIIAQLAAAADLEVERIEVARRLRRRHSSSPFLRESVVFLHA
ncbi:MAG: hypothetical protein ACRDLE_05390 [Gaiellaceae bacterium]